MDNEDSSSLSHLIFSFPSFSQTPSSLFHSSPTSISFSLSTCSFQSTEESLSISHSLLKSEGGMIELTMIVLKGSSGSSPLSFSSSVSPFLFTDETKDITLTSMKISYISLSSSSSLFSFSFSSSSIPSNEYSHVLSLSSSEIKNIEGENKPCVMECNEDRGVEMIINEVTLNYCMSEESEFGGAISFFLSINGHLLVQNCELSSCEAIKTPPPSSLSSSSLHYNQEPSKYGHGGFLFINTPSDEEPSSLFLNFLFQDDRFQNNNATYGRDVYFQCWSIERQINEFQFDVDFENRSFDQTNAIWGEEKKNGNEQPQDLFSFHE
jgi:hypothetical protein